VLGVIDGDTKNRLGSMSTAAGGKYGLHNRKIRRQYLPKVKISSKALNQYVQTVVSIAL
jgi:hypothetical protein